MHEVYLYLYKRFLKIDIYIKCTKNVTAKTLIEVSKHFIYFHNSTNFSGVWCACVVDARKTTYAPSNNQMAKLNTNEMRTC